jgi:hypothetical protein
MSKDRINPFTSTNNTKFTESNLLNNLKLESGNQKNTPNTRNNKISSAGENKREIYVFDSFKGKDISVDGSGSKNISHGKMVVEVIKSQTGITPIQIEADAAGSMTGKLKELLARPDKDLSYLYLNFSNDGGIAKQNNLGIENLISQLAARGANVYVAAGNIGRNSLMQELGSQKNIRFVAASNDVLGLPQKNWSSTPATFSQGSSINRVAPGRAAMKNVPGGFSIDNNKTPEITDVSKIPYDASGKNIKDVGSDLLVGNLDLAEHLKPSAVITLGVYRSRYPTNINAEALLKATGFKSVDQLDKLYIHLGSMLAAEKAQTSELGGGGVVLYSAGKDGQLKLFLQKPEVTLFPQSSIAAAAALSADVNNSSPKTK